MTLLPSWRLLFLVAGLATSFLATLFLAFGFAAFLGVLASFGLAAWVSLRTSFSAGLAILPNLKEPETPVPLDCFKLFFCWLPVS